MLVMVDYFMMAWRIILSFHETFFLFSWDVDDYYTIANVVSPSSME